jgi:hypothetical protein
MKHLMIVVLAALCITYFPSVAQNAIEIQAGMNFANLSDPGNLAPDARWTTLYGFTASAFVDIGVAGKFSIFPGVRYIQKGTNSNVTGFTSNVHLTNTYYELPLYGKYELYSDFCTVALVSGPTFAYCGSSRTEGTARDTGYVSINSKSDYKDYNISWDLGVHTAISFSNQWSFVVSGMYSFGIIKIATGGSKEQTRDVLLTAGVAYTL